MDDSQTSQNLSSHTNSSHYTRYIYGAFGEMLSQYNGASPQYSNIRRRADTVSTPEGETIGRMEASPPESKDDILEMKAGIFDRYYYLNDQWELLMMFFILCKTQLQQEWVRPVGIALTL